MKKPAARKRPATVKAVKATAKVQRKPCADESIFLASDEEDRKSQVMPEESESEIMQASDEDAPKDTARPECPLSSMSVSNIIQELLKVDGVKTGLQSSHSKIPNTGNTITVKVASICSGLGIADMVFESLNPALQELLDPIPALKFETVFMCEKEPWKAKWLSMAFGPKIIFEDMTCLGSGRGKDAVTEQFHQLPKVTGFTMGFPCTSISAQNSCPSSFLDAASATGSGFQALLDYTDYNDELEWLITENVRNLTHKRKQFNGECPIDIQNSALEKRGFVPIHALVSSHDYGVPQSRSRCWGLYVKATQLKQFGPDPRSLFLNMTLQHMPIYKIIDPSLATETPHISRASSGKKWQSDFEKMKKKYGKAAVMKNLELLDGKGMPLTRRELSILSIAITILQQRGFDPLTQTMIIQVDQNYERNTFVRSDPFLCPCLIPHGKYVITSQWRCLSGQEKLKMQGLGIEDIAQYKIKELSEQQQSDLAGNSFTTGVCAAAILSILSCWHPSKRAVAP